MNDPRQRRIAPDARDADLERAAAVDRAGEHVVADVLVDRQRLAGDRRLVDGAAASDDRAVQRNLLARPHDDDGARLDAIDVDPLIAGGGAHDRLGGRQIHQRADGGTRALQRARLERLSDGEQEHDGRRFRPLPQRDRAGRGDQHEHVDIERADAHRAQCLPRRHRDAGRERSAKERDRNVTSGFSPASLRRRTAEKCLDDEPDAERGARDRDQDLPRARLSLRRRDRLLVLQPRPHAGVGDGIGDRRRRQLRGVVLHVEPLAHEVGGEIFEAREVLEPPLEHCDFLAAVHPLDLEGRLGVELTDRAGRHRCGSAV